MHEPFVKIKDVEFLSYFCPTKRHGHVGTLQLSFRLAHMQEDELIIDIQQDEKDNLYTSSIEYYNTRDDEQFSLMNKFDQEEMHALLKAVLNSEVAKKELVYYDMSDYKDCYAKCITYDFEVMVTHTNLSQEETVENAVQLPMDIHHQFAKKTAALHFFHTVIQSYKEKAKEEEKRKFGAYKIIWQPPQTKHDFITWISLTYKGQEISTLDEYNQL